MEGIDLGLAKILPAVYDRPASLPSMPVGIMVDVAEVGKGPTAVCILCESGYHDAAFEIRHIQQCGCPCHGASHAE
jgi:hypothetical protein